MCSSDLFRVNADGKVIGNVSVSAIYTVTGYPPKLGENNIKGNGIFNGSAMFDIANLNGDVAANLKGGETDAIVPQVPFISSERFNGADNLGNGFSYAINSSYYKDKNGVLKQGGKLEESYFTSQDGLIKVAAAESQIITSDGENAKKVGAEIGRASCRERV